VTVLDLVPSTTAGTANVFYGRSDASATRPFRSNIERVALSNNWGLQEIAFEAARFAFRPGSLGEFARQLERRDALEFSSELRELANRAVAQRAAEQEVDLVGLASQLAQEAAELFD
jgi:hypothetical protein